jgi:AraC family transcriptional regulator, dual regulator of chb operon
MQVNTSDRFNAPHLPAWISRPFYRPGFRYPMHRHRFAEIFWIESGEIRHRIGNSGCDETMRAGDLRFIHPDTAHATASDHAAILVNLAFPTAYLRELGPFVGELPFRAGEAPGLHVDAERLTMLSDWADRLANPGLTRLDVGAFLLWLLAERQRAQSERPTSTWLDAALSGFTTPQQLAGGVGSLAQLAGRSTGVLSRQVRKRFNCTAIQLINRRRIAWMARELRMSATPIPALAEACGLGNLGHCYRLFRAAHGCAPGAYRQRAQSAAG